MGKQNSSSTQAGQRNGQMLTTEKLVKAYHQRRVVNCVSITVAAGEIVGLLGPNGAGKTTTFNMVVGVVSRTKACVQFQTPQHHPPADAQARPTWHRLSHPGAVHLPQAHGRGEHSGDSRNLQDERGEERAIRLKYLLDELDLAPLARSKAYTLSGGEKRRLEITRALVTSPKLLLLDEPFSGIDPIAVYEVQKIVRRLKERGLGILITDHNVRETLKLVDRAT